MRRQWTWMGRSQIDNLSRTGVDGASESARLGVEGGWLCFKGRHELPIAVAITHRCQLDYHAVQCVRMVRYVNWFIRSLQPGHQQAQPFIQSLQVAIKSELAVNLIDIYNGPQLQIDQWFLCNKH